MTDESHIKIRDIPKNICSYSSLMLHLQCHKPGLEKPQCCWCKLGMSEKILHRQVTLNSYKFFINQLYKEAL